MTSGWQVLACAGIVGGLGLSQAQQLPKVLPSPPPAKVPEADPVQKLDWKPLDIGRGLFTDALGMLDREREEYANNLAAEATAEAMDGKGSKASMTQVRKLLALSLQLAPRNRQALVLSFQLGRGILPTQKPDGFNREVLGRLLITRSGLLRKQGGDENLLLARAFTELAADLDPTNEDAVYASEVQRLDHANVDWLQFTDPPKSTP